LEALNPSSKKKRKFVKIRKMVQVEVKPIDKTLVGLTPMERMEAEMRKKNAEKASK
jgi:hypothetical protein